MEGLAQKTVPGIAFTSPQEAYSKVEAAGGPYPVPREHYPLMVTFADVDDPTSVQRVDPDDLAATFGAGVRLKAVTLEIVDGKSITAGRVVGVLGNLGVIGDARPTLIPNPPRLVKDAADPAVQYLSVNAFSTEAYK